jgi:hypothetical protein
MALDQDAALQSASWGIDQVMGSNFKDIDFSDINSMVTDIVKGENEQLLAMADFIKTNSLVGALQRQDWVIFVRSYNGTGFKKNQYDERLAAAHAKSCSPTWPYEPRRQHCCILGLIPDLSMA